MGARSPGSLYPLVEPLERGLVQVGEGQSLYVEVCGNPLGKAAVVLHGGPGSGCPPRWRRYLDPASYRTVVFDQRGCGRSRPLASDPACDLSVNTTAHLVADMEELRRHLGIERWLVLGGSWGSTLALAYAQAHPRRVSELVLFSVVTTTSAEVRWVTHDVGRLAPEEWDRFRRGVPEPDRRGSLVHAYARLLSHPDRSVRQQAADDWCRWEAVHVSLGLTRRADRRFEDPDFRLCFARLVTHYWANHAFVDDGSLLARIERIAGVPGVLVHGRLDVSSPLDIPWGLWRAWPAADLVVVEGAGHAGTHPGMAAAVVEATDRFATR